MSDTPRTDAKAQFFGFNPDEGEEFVQIDFARQLERENAALRAYLKTGDMPDPQWSKDDILHMYDLAIDERDAANESLAALHRENAALREDKERLDWIARNRSVSATERPLSVTPESLRESIDAARKEIQS